MDYVEDVYGTLQRAYQHFNGELFNGTLPACLITLSHKKSAYGYFQPECVQGRDEEYAGVHHISLNLFTFKERTREQILSTLVHEMVHLQQQEFGKPPKRPSHNKEWATMMKEVGLYPSSTGEEGGKETGRSVSHYIVEGGEYEESVKGFSEPLEIAGLLRLRERKVRVGKVKHVCPTCDEKAWIKADSEMTLRCGDCDVALEPA